MNPVYVKIIDHIAIVTIDNPPVNALSLPVRQGLSDVINKTNDCDEIHAVILTGAGHMFCAGADVRELGKPPETPHLPDLIAQIYAAAKPWISAIHGRALGGGLEITLGCHYRVADKGAMLGLPEVNLGLIPGAGATVRLPRLIGPKAALDIIASGKAVSAEKALELGLIDCVTGDALVREAKQFAAKIIAGHRPSTLMTTPVQAPNDPAVWQAQLAAIRQKARSQIAPLAAIDAIENAIDLPADQALAKERKLFLKLKDNPQSAALRYIFMAERAAAKMPCLKGVAPRPFNRIGIIGGGTMGAGIAASVLLSGLHVTLLERDDGSLQSGLERINTILAQSHSRGLISADALTCHKAALAGTTSYADLSNADMVIEAVFEDMAVKKDVFTRLDTVTRPDTILATNTSYLDVGEIAKAVSDPSRVLGLHFFSPAYIMKLLEIIHPPKVADGVLATGFALAKRLGKIAVPAGVCDGFIGNRMMSAYRRACEYMLEDGALPQEIDAAMVGFGFPMGVFAMADLAGLDIAWAMRKRQAATRPADLRYVDIADRLCEMGRLGRKTGLGWYDYSDNARGKPDKIVETLILTEAKRKNIARQTLPAEDIIAGILSAMQQEGQFILQEGIAETAQAIDVVMVNGYGFPRWRGGPMYMRQNPQC